MHRFADLLKLECCSQSVKVWFAENELLLNADKSDVMFIGTSAQLCAAKNVASVVVAGASLHPTDEMKSLGVVIDSRLTLQLMRLQCAERAIIIYGLCGIYAIY